MVTDGSKGRSLARSVLLYFGTALLVAACSSSGDSAESTSSSTVATTASSTTTSSSTTTTAVATTATTLSSLDPVAEAEQAAAQAVLDGAAAWISCTEDLAACDVDEALVATTSGTELEELVAVLTAWKANGWEVRPPVDPSHDGIEVLQVEMADDRAVVTYCEIDGAVVVDVGAGPGGSDVIVDDEIVSVLAESSAELGQDLVWRVYDTVIVKEFSGGQGCTI